MVQSPETLSWEGGEDGRSYINPPPWCTVIHDKSLFEEHLDESLPRSKVYRLQIIFIVHSILQNLPVFRS